MGICNGFQILIEAGLLPGGLIRNTGLKFVCRYVNLRVETTETPFTRACLPQDVLRIVVKHNEGNYTVDPATFETMKANDQIVLRYVNATGERAPGANPNGSLDDIAGVCNEARTVFGMMPHPENSVEDWLAGGSDGRQLFQSMIDSLRGAEVTA
jgi:phosphoribosylformylglycinamidine synthase